MQLSLFNPSANPNIDSQLPDRIGSLFKVPDFNKAEELENLAKGMTDSILRKKNPACGLQRPTKRRKLMANSMIEEGIKLETIQTWLYKMADAAKEGELDQSLRGITSKTQLETLHEMINWSPEKIGETFSSSSNQDKNKIETLSRANIYTERMARNAISALLQLHLPEETDPVRKRIAELELEIVGYKGRDYFPSPDPVVSLIVQLAEIKPGMKILEPSAGKGSICGKVLDLYPEVKLDVVEIDTTLRELLHLKGFNLVGTDFLQYHPKDPYSRIVMNPPFSDMVSHVDHAYECLEARGRLVTVLPENVFTSSKYKQFKEWIDQNATHIEKLPKDAFISSDNSTGVQTRIVAIAKR
ncbi:hypothetical protein WA1_50405 [Scytonema hofmannii PCC 7110]|uniref:Uncharacterized protein n=1 Tax=Scytonema hofmannii PCC 7110 TaxID=128403 RepID=A0A139WR86_9CYAN|nr:methyltransferase [Scytonema hofmannii]KYC34938.1 hypothetical protein WA1_50405 [Scytonema hofmannii PCC 7110]